jgi:hypothetical protein
MERLTKRYVDDFGQKAITACGETYFEGEDGYVVVDRLASYEDLEEQGLLVRLPDDLNKVLYQVNYRWTECTEYGEENNKCEIYDCKCECDSRKEYYIAEVGLQYIQIVNYYDRLGKFLFLTREEAEKKLEDIQNDKT